MPGEEIIWVGKVSKYVYLWAWAWLLLGIGAFYVASHPELLDQVRRTRRGSEDSVVALAAAAGTVLILISVYAWLRAFLRRWTTELVITSRRVVAKVGLISRRTWEINTGAVEGVQVHQSVLGRICNFGDLKVTGRGAGLTPVRWVDDPIEFRKRLPSN